LTDLLQNESQFVDYIRIQLKVINCVANESTFRMAKTYLGVHFLQNPNDAITIAEILYKQDIDLVIETGTYLGGAALFFASVMYQYRYNAVEKTLRPFKIITMDISPAARAHIDQFPLLASHIIFLPHSSASSAARSIVNTTFFNMNPQNVFISLDGDHYAEAVYNELLHYQQYSVKKGNYILVQDTRLSRKWHTMYCAASKYDGPCNGPQEAVNWFLKNNGSGRYISDTSKEYLFSTHHKGWLKRIV
jgi:cephalosporin hydroxylase